MKFDDIAVRFIAATYLFSTEETADEKRKQERAQSNSNML